MLIAITMGEKYNGLEDELKLFAKFVCIFVENRNVFKANKLNKCYKPATVLQGCIWY